MKEIKKFNKLVLIILALSYAAIAGIFNFIFPDKFHWSLLIIPVLVAGVTSLLHKRLLSSTDGRPQKFINTFMGMTGIKLMIYLFFILIYIFVLTEYAIPFLAIFFTLYIIYTFVEISYLLKFLRTLEK